MLTSRLQTKQQTATRIYFISGLSRYRSRFAAPASAEIDVDAITSLCVVAAPSAELSSVMVGKRLAVVLGTCVCGTAP